MASDNGIEVLCDELNKTIERVLLEWDLSSGEVLGAIEAVKLDFWMDVNRSNESEEGK